MYPRILLLIISALFLSACTQIRAPFISVKPNAQTVEQTAAKTASYMLQEINKSEQWRHRLLSSRLDVIPTKAGKSQQEIEFSDRIHRALRQEIKRHPRVHLVEEHDLRRPINFRIHSRVKGSIVNGEEQMLLKMWMEERKSRRIIAAVQSPIVLGTCVKIHKPITQANTKSQAVDKATTASTKHLLENIRKERGCLGKLLPTQVTIAPPQNNSTQKPVAFAGRVNKQISQAVRKQSGFKVNHGQANHGPVHYAIKSSVDGKVNRGQENIIMRMWTEDKATQRVLAASTSVINHDVCTRISQTRTFSDIRPQRFELAARKDIKRLLHSMNNERGCMTELFNTGVALSKTHAANTAQSILFSEQLRKAIAAEINHFPKFQTARGAAAHYTVKSNVTGKVVNGQEIFTLNMWAEHNKSGRVLAKSHSRLSVKHGLQRPLTLNTNIIALENLNQQLLDAVNQDRHWRSQIKATEVAVAPTIDGITQETLQTGEVLLKAMQQAGNSKNIKVVALSEESLKTAHYIAFHVLTQDKNLGNHMRLQSWIRDSKTGRLLAQAQSIVASQQLPYKLTKEAEDSPVYPVAPKQGVRFNLQQQLAATRSPQAFRQSMQALATLADAGKAYSGNQYTNALQKYRKAANLPAGKQNSRALAGTYVSLLRLGKFKEAQAIFGELLKLGFLKADTLTFKILFAVNSVNFFGGNFLSQQYNDWIDQIGGYVANNNTCLKITGHSSNTGTAAYNLDLSARRSANIEKLMQRAEPGTAGRITTDGKGFSENIIGIGTDDIRDAVDRRVEFKRVGC